MAAIEQTDESVQDVRSDGVKQSDDMPLPEDPKTIFLGILCLLAVLASSFLAREVILPVVIAIILKLLLQPLVRILEKIKIPKAVGALIAIAAVLGVFVGLGAILTASASHWATILPQEWPQLEKKLSFVQDPLQHLQNLAGKAGIHFGGAGDMLSNPGGMVTAVFSNTSSIAGHLLEGLLVLFYLLVFGETFLLRLVEILPSFSDKRQAVELSSHIERDLSAYLITVTIINAIVGCATSAVMWACGVPGAILWGVVAFCINFVPILGPFCGVVLFLGVGFVTQDGLWYSILPAALYLGIHMLEGEIITPMLLASRFTINPVAIMISLIFWYWMWSVAGAILAVPMLAILKITCDRIRPFRAVGHLLEG